MATQIQTLDVREFTSGGDSGDNGLSASARKAAFVEKLGRAFHDIGFVVITGHPIDAAQQRAVYDKIREFFALPVPTKRSYEIAGTGGARGYTTFGKEHAKDHPVGDLKEFFHVGMELPPGHRFAGSRAYPPNVRVKEIPGFDETLGKLYADLLSLGTTLLRAIALYLGQPENYFDDQVGYGNSVLRPIHYPPLTGREEPGAVRSSAHEDINLITLLIGASSPGLEVKSRQGEWVAITTGPSEIVVNVGDMLQRLTNYRLVSTTHRVVNPPTHPADQDAAQAANPAAGPEASTRFSLPFFLHPVSDMSLRALPSCVDAKNPVRDPDILAGEYLEQRLREIGLK